MRGNNVFKKLKQNFACYAYARLGILFVHNKNILFFVVLKAFWVQFNYSIFHNIEHQRKVYIIQFNYE